MGSRKDAKTQRGKNRCPSHSVLASLRLERSGREKSIIVKQNPDLRSMIAGNARRIAELNFRSQYMRTKLARLLKRATLTARQAERFQSAMEQG